MVRPETRYAKSGDVHIGYHGRLKGKDQRGEMTGRGIRSERNTRYGNAEHTCISSRDRNPRWATLSGFYAGDARLTIVDSDNPPSRPLEIMGSAAIAAYYDDVCGRTMTHRITAAAAEGGQIVFTQTCTYPDGKRVMCAASMELVDGRIARQTSIQVWDA